MPPTVHTLFYPALSIATISSSSFFFLLFRVIKSGRQRTRTILEPFLSFSLPLLIQYRTEAIQQKDIPASLSNRSGKNEYFVILVTIESMK